MAYILYNKEVKLQKSKLLKPWKKYFKISLALNIISFGINIVLLVFTILKTIL